LTKKPKFLHGVHRWWVLLLIVLSIIAAQFVSPVQPHIQMAPEKLIEEPLFNLGPLGDFYLFNTIPTLILTIILIVIFAWAVKRSIEKNDMVPKGISSTVEMLIETVYNMTESSTGARWAKQIFPWFMTIVIYVLLANLLKLIPGFESIGVLHHSEHGHAIEQVAGNVFTIVKDEGEYILTPFLRGISVDLNFTAALALIAVVMIQVIGVKAHGLNYFAKFINVKTLFSKPFFGAMDFIVGLLELISEFAKILSFAFRLLGNMFAGMVLSALVISMLPVFAPSAIYLFELFIGIIQAFVFGLLTMVFMAQATMGHGSDHESAEAHS